MGSACSNAKGEVSNPSPAAGPNGAHASPSGPKYAPQRSEKEDGNKAAGNDSVPVADQGLVHVSHDKPIEAAVEAQLQGKQEGSPTALPSAAYPQIKQTWAEATKQAGFAISVYNKLLSKYTAATEALFYGVDIAVQSQRLVDMISAGVKLLDTPDSLIPVMLQLGSRHVIYGVSDIHFDMFNDALIMAIQDAIGYWNPSLTEQWIKILMLFKTAILHGYTTPAGLQMRKKYNQRVQKTLYRCWATVKASEPEQSSTSGDSDDSQSFAAVLLRFGRHKIGGRRADLFANMIKKRGDFMRVLNLAFEKGVEDEEVIRVVREVGTRHIRYGVEEKDYDAFAGPFIAAFQQKASPETFNPFVKAQLSLFWVSLSKLMLQGAVEALCSFTLRHAPKPGAGFAMIKVRVDTNTPQLKALWARGQKSSPNPEDEERTKNANAKNKKKKSFGDAVSEPALICRGRFYELLAELIETLESYEVPPQEKKSAENDSKSPAETNSTVFTIVARSLQNAVVLAMRLHLLLLRADPAATIQLPSFVEVFSINTDSNTVNTGVGGATPSAANSPTIPLSHPPVTDVWRAGTPLARVAVHWCKDAAIKFHAEERCYTYSGPDVEICSRLVGEEEEELRSSRAADDGASCVVKPGQTLMTEPTYQYLLTVGSFKDPSALLGDMMSLDGVKSARVPSTTDGSAADLSDQKASGDTIKMATLKDVLKTEVFIPDFSIPIAQSVKNIGYPSNMASSGHPAKANLLNVSPLPLEGRKF